MGRETRNFRQTGKSISGSAGAQTYAKIQRQENWKVQKGMKKGEKLNGQS